MTSKSNISDKVNDVFQYLLTVPDNVIYAIIDDFNHKVELSYTSVFKRRLGTILDELSNKVSSIENNTRFDEKNDNIGAIKITAKILEISSDSNLVKYYIDHYRNLNYEVSSKIPLQYSFNIEIDNDKVNVIARNKRNKKITLGKFDSIELATEFLDYVKANNVTDNLIYSIYVCMGV